MPPPTNFERLGYIVPVEDWHWLDYEESMSASYFMDRRVHETLEDMLPLR